MYDVMSRILLGCPAHVLYLSPCTMLFLSTKLCLRTALECRPVRVSQINVGYGYDGGFLPVLGSGNAGRHASHKGRIITVEGVYYRYRMCV
jgi:hypothetical protein